VNNLILMGKQVVVVPNHPKMQLAENVPVTPEFRKEINDWMAGFFGYTNTVPEGQVLTTGDKIFVRPEDYNKLKSLGVPRNNFWP
jgi:hypothetical protein